MRALRLALLFAFVLPAVACASRSDAEGAAPETPVAAVADTAAAPAWTTIDEALAAAQESGNPVLISIHADWCGWCKRLDQQVYADAEVRAYLEEHFETARFRPDADGEITFKGEPIQAGALAHYFGSRGTPNTVFLFPDGELLTILPGFRPRDQFLITLKYLAEEAYEDESFEAYYQRMTADAAPDGQQG